MVIKVAFVIMWLCSAVFVNHRKRFLILSYLLVALQMCTQHAGYKQPAWLVASSSPRMPCLMR